MNALYSNYSSKLFKAFLTFLLLFPAISYGDLYYWIDQNGVKHYSNYQPDNNGIETKKTEEYFQDEYQNTTIGKNHSENPEKFNGHHKTSTKQNKTSSGPKVNIKFIFYDFDAVNSNDISDEMAKKTPIRYNGEKFRGSAYSKIKYFFYPKDRNGSWYIDSISTTVDVTFTMPKWQDYRKANRAEQKKWDKYYNALMEHENGHKKIAIAAAKNIEIELLALSRFADKHSLEKHANFKAKMIIRESRKHQKQFDIETNHGITTGVVLEK